MKRTGRTLEEVPTGSDCGQVVVEIANGKKEIQAVRAVGICEQTCCRWRKEFGGLKRYGYSGLMALLKQAGWKVGKDRVEIIWRRLW